MDTSSRALSLTNVSLEKMQDVARELAPLLKPGVTLCLWGDLGAGKTTFSRLLLQELNHNIGQVPSPTFNIVQNYDTPQGPVWHCDLYRLKDSREIIELGLEEAVYEAIVIIEWPQKMGSYLPYDRLDCHLIMAKDLSSESTRDIKLLVHGECDIDLREMEKLDVNKAMVK